MTMDGFLLVMIFLRILRANTCPLLTGGMEVKCVVKRTNLRVRDIHSNLAFQDRPSHRSLDFGICSMQLFRRNNIYFLL